jgi:Glycosyltransferase
VKAQPYIHIDKISSQEISGWFYDPTNKLEKNLTLLANGNPIASFEANLPRSDVAAAIGCAPDCGFQVKFHKPLKSKTKLEIRVNSTKLIETEFLTDADKDPTSTGQTNKNIYFDVSDLVYFIGHHDNLTGIQRVQSCIILSIIREKLHPLSETKFLSYDNRKNEFILLDTYYFSQLLEDLFLPKAERAIHFNAHEARIGILPNAKSLSIDKSKEHVLCLLGAAWVNQDYFARILELKRSYSFRFVMTVHDLIPIYAAETCDQGTTKVFKQFLNKAYRYTDIFLSVSQNTAKDIVRYAERLELSPPPIYVTQNGSHFNDFISIESNEKIDIQDFGLEGDYVLFVSTIEGRKNHQLMFDVWKKIKQTGIEPPTLVCVGRNGWRADEFLNNLIATNYLDGKIKILSDISDSELSKLYENCLFSVYPSLYEGWGLPVGESLSKGKICVTSRNSSIPEVAGDLGIYVDPFDPDDATNKIREIITNTSFREQLEREIREKYNPIPWSTVAKRTLQAALSALNEPEKNTYPVITPGQEYSFASIPEINNHRFGDAVVREIENARKLPITKKFAENQSFTIGSELRHGRNWCAPEGWGCWSRLGKHEITFQVQEEMESSNGYILYLQIQVPNPLIGGEHQYKIFGRTIFSEKITEPENLIKIEIDNDCKKPINGSQIYKIECNIYIEDRKKEELAKIDNRLLGIGYKSFALVKKDDIPTRLSILENLAFS